MRMQGKKNSLYDYELLISYAYFITQKNMKDIFKFYRFYF